MTFPLQIEAPPSTSTSNVKNPAPDLPGRELFSGGPVLELGKIVFGQRLTGVYQSVVSLYNLDDSTAFVEVVELMAESVLAIF
jgi:hypothetical protein